jgi:hypothetical protein
MSIQQMPDDIISSIYKAVIKKEENVNVLGKFKDDTIDFFNKNKIAITPSIQDISEEHYITICDFIKDYINSLTKKQIDNIICHYGISNGMKLLHDYHKIGADTPDIGICEIISTIDYGFEKEIVELILYDEIGYNINWRTEGTGKLNTYIEFEDAMIAHMNRQ